MTRIQIFPCICKGFHFRRRIKLFKNDFRIVDIEINVSSCLFVNLKISLIFSSFPGKFMRVSKVKCIYASYATVYKLVCIFLYKSMHLCIYASYATVCKLVCIFLYKSMHLCIYASYATVYKLVYISYLSLCIYT